MEPRTIAGSRVKASIFLAIALVFIAIFATSLMGGDANPLPDWAGIAFFGLGFVVFAAMVISPSALRLDAEGFVYTGLFGRSYRTLWGDVGPFFLFDLPRGGSMIAYNFLPGHAPKSPLLGLSRAMGADAAIPGQWTLSKQALIDLLNDYRTRAAGPPQP